MTSWNRQEDYSKRDESIRVNSYTTVRRRTGLPHELFASYWRDVHGPLCSRLPGLGWYVQHHFNREQDGHLWIFADGMKSIPDYVLDGMVEIGFGSVANQQRFKQASPLLFSDEQNIFDESMAYDLPQGCTTFVDRFSDPAPDSAHIVDHLQAHFHAIVDQEKNFAQYLREELAKPFSKEEQVLKVRLHLPEPHNNTKPNPPAPDVEHAVEQDALSSASWRLFLKVHSIDGGSLRLMFSSDL